MRGHMHEPICNLHVGVAHDCPEVTRMRRRLHAILVVARAPVCNLHLGFAHDCPEVTRMSPHLHAIRVAARKPNLQFACGFCARLSGGHAKGASMFATPAFVLHHISPQLELSRNQFVQGCPNLSSIPSVLHHQKSLFLRILDLLFCGHV